MLRTRSSGKPLSYLRRTTMLRVRMRTALPHVDAAQTQILYENYSKYCTASSRVRHRSRLKLFPDQPAVSFLSTIACCIASILVYPFFSPRFHDDCSFAALLLWGLGFGQVTYNDSLWRSLACSLTTNKNHYLE